jgi:hypothetical protein
MPYVVMVDDNAHYMDESRRYRLGAFKSPEAALERCRRIVDGFLFLSHVPGYTADELLGEYTMFGEDPFVLCQGVPLVRFNAWDYAKARCREICGEAGSRVAPPARPAGAG